MQQTFEALGGILINAIPTVLILICLHFYLKFMLFGPLQRVLKQREELTAGARKAAELSHGAAERKAQEYEAKLNDARAEVYKQQEETRKAWLEDQSKQISDVRSRVDTTLKENRLQIAAEAQGARQDLQQTSSDLADQIANRILTRQTGKAA